MTEDTAYRRATPVWRSWPFLVGYCLTTFFIIFWLVIASTAPSATEECITNFCVFWRSTPNEVGDTFAGLFGSLAFVWIIVTVLVQGLELREQRLEIKASREAQEAQAQSLNLQAAILMNQNIALQEQRHDTFIEALFASIKQSVNDLKGPLMTWEIQFQDGEGNLVKKELKPFEIDIIEEQRFLRFSSNLLDARLSITLGGFWTADQHDPETVEILRKPPRTHVHRGLLEYLERVLEEKEKCSLQMQLEVQRMAIFQFEREFKKLLEIDDYWGDDFDPMDHYPI
ncbi:hypothetical protein [uncultured Sulfitobacter sp.]|uniref:hypothetical protein n=1 Tax=uncultured Sulfitobacter sp. TaxID=191468 RepID=UPI0026250257|nr:hypothetical protein [uncultured Sulfitobacter sp.]